MTSSFEITKSQKGACKSRKEYDQEVDLEDVMEASRRVKVDSLLGLAVK